MEITIQILLRLIFVFVLILVGCTCYLMWQRRREVLGQRKKEAYLREKQMLWYRYFRGLETFDESLIPKNKYEVQAIEAIFLTYLKDLFTPSISEKITWFSNEYLKDHYLGLLRNGKWAERINSMERIVDFQIDRLIENCEKMIGQKLSHEEHFQLMKIFVVLKEEKFLNLFLATPIVLSEYEYKKLLFSLNEDVLQELMNRMEELPNPGKYAMIDILGIKRNAEALPFLEAQLGHEDDEVRIRTLKAIYEIGIIIDSEKYLQFNTSPIWEERLMQAKLLGILPIAYSLPYLQTLLHDESWWVRSEAAKSIGKDKDGETLLKEIIQKTTDPYAKDMATQVLGRGSSL